MLHPVALATQIELVLQKRFFFFFILRCAFSPCNYTKIIKRILLYIFIQKKKKKKTSAAFIAGKKKLA